MALDRPRHYLRQDRYLPLREAAAYLGMKPRKLREILPEHLLFRVSARKLLVRKGELDAFMERYRQGPQEDFKRIVDDALEAVCGSRQ